jgi:hypothetical protein
MSDEKNLIAVFIREEALGGRDEVHVYSFPNWPYCFAEHVDNTSRGSPKLDFMLLADMLTFCGYVRQDAP